MLKQDSTAISSDEKGESRAIYVWEPYTEWGSVAEKKTYFEEQDFQSIKRILFFLLWREGGFFVPFILVQILNIASIYSYLFFKQEGERGSDGLTLPALPQPDQHVFIMAYKRSVSIETISAIYGDLMTYISQAIIIRPRAVRGSLCFLFH